MTTLATLATIAVAFAWILGQEWRQLTRSREWGNRLTRNNRYVCKLGEAKPNERKVS